MLFYITFRLIAHFRTNPCGHPFRGESVSDRTRLSTGKRQRYNNSPQAVSTDQVCLAINIGNSDFLLISEFSAIRAYIPGYGPSMLCYKVRYAHNVLRGAMMHKRMTITLDEAVYEGLNRRIGKRRMSQFIEDLLRPHVLDTSLDDGYQAMAADKAREAEAQDWCNSLAKDMADEAR